MTVISSLTYDVYDNLGENDFDLFERLGQL